MSEITSGAAPADHGGISNEIAAAVPATAEIVQAEPLIGHAIKKPRNSDGALRTP